jgi:hypothetical protein
MTWFEPLKAARASLAACAFFSARSSPSMIRVLSSHSAWLEA